MKATDGRLEVKLSKLADDGNRRDKALCRMCAECVVIKNQMIPRIGEHISLHNIQMPETYKSVDSSRSIRFLRKENDPVLNMVLSMMESATREIECAEKEIEKRYSDKEDVKILMSMKGIGMRTAATIVTAIDGIERFDHPDRKISKDGDPLVRYGLANVVTVHSMFVENSMNLFAGSSKPIAEYCIDISELTINASMG